MKPFLRESWAWIVAPMVLVAAMLIAVLLLTDADTVGPFLYAF